MKIQRWHFTVMFLAIGTNILALDKPLILYQGDSIVEKRADGGYGQHAISFWNEAGFDCRVIRSTRKGVNGREVAVARSFRNLNSALAGKSKNAEKQAKIDKERKRFALLHYTQGIDEVEGMMGEHGDFDTYKRDRLLSFEEDLEEYIAHFQREFPNKPFIYATTTRPDASTSRGKAKPKDDRFRSDVVLLNEVAKKVCSRLHIPVNDLYQLCVDQDLKPFDGRHFRTKLSKPHLSKTSFEFSKPYVTEPQVYLINPSFNQAVQEGSPIELKSHVQQANGKPWSVKYFAGSKRIGTADTPPYSVSWTPPAGEFQLWVEATDGTETITSRHVSITVFAFPLQINVGGDRTEAFVSDRAYAEKGSFGYHSHDTVIRTVKPDIAALPAAVSSRVRTQRSGNAAIVYTIPVPEGSYEVAVVAYSAKTIDTNGSRVTATSPGLTRLTDITPKDGVLRIEITGASDKQPASICAIRIDRK